MRELGALEYEVFCLFFLQFGSSLRTNLQGKFPVEVSCLRLPKHAHRPGVAFFVVAHFGSRSCASISVKAFQAQFEDVVHVA